MADITLRTHHPHKVYTKAKWADDWVEEKNFFCDRCTFACGPAFSSAEFSWTAGRVMSYTEKQFFDRSAKELVDKYVKVEIEQGDDEAGEAIDPVRWYGIFVDDDRDYGGQISPTQTLSRQKVMALGLEWLLERTLLDSSFCLIKNSSGGTDEVETERAIPFNYAGGNWTTRRIKGNQATGGDKGVLFASTLEGAFTWNARDIFEYLLAYHPPKDKNGDDQLGWGSGDNASVLTGYEPVIDAHGSSVKQVLDMLCDRRRLLGWKVEVQTTDIAGGSTETAILVQPFSFNKDSITLPGGTVLDPNEDTVELELADDALVQRLVIGRDAAISYRRVIARGERVVVCGTMGYAGGSGEFDKDWTDPDETSYEAGAVGYPGLSSPEDDEKRSANQEYRNQDKFERVYRYFKVKPEKVAGWLPPETVKVNDKRIRLWPPGGRFLATLPLQTNVDYTTPSTSLTASLTTDGREDYLAPYAFIGDGSRYYSLEKMAAGDADAIEAGGRKWAATLRMRHDCLGFTLDVHGGPQHAIAKGDFTPGDAIDTDADFGWNEDLSLDWQNVYVTVAVETDTWAEAQWPTTPSSNDDVMKELIVHVPDRRMEYVMGGTVLGVDLDGTLDLSTSADWIVDDSEELENVARITYEWYRQPRRTVDLTMRSIACPYHVGQLVTEIKRLKDETLEEVNSVITQIAFDLRQGTYNLKTQFAELDTRAML